MPKSGTYHLVKSGSIDAGGIMERPSEDIPPCWTLYVTVEDVRGLVAGNNLHLVVPIEETPVGPFCGFLDPQGAYISAIQYTDATGEGGVGDFLKTFRTHGLFSWFELRTSDPESAADFYSNLFGWTIEAQEMPGGTYRVIKIGEVGIGAICGLPHPEIPPHWGAYVTVDDIEYVIERAGSEGATVLVPILDIPRVGRMAQIQDPEGASLSLIQYEPWKE